MTACMLVSVVEPHTHECGCIHLNVIMVSYHHCGVTFVSYLKYSLQAFCFIAFLLFLLLALWVIVFMVQKWNNKVVKYIIKDAVS